MKKNILKVIALLMLLCIVFSFAACDKLPFLKGDNNDDNSDNNSDQNNNNTDDTGNQKPNPDDAIEKLELIKDGKAQFQVVYTQTSQASGAAIAKTFVDRLIKLKALPQGSKPVSDTDATKVQDCEIIIGAEALNRGAECSVSTKYLGSKGQAIKVVGNRVIVATGSHTMLQSCFNTFTRSKMGISDRTTTLKNNISLEKNYSLESLTEYFVESIKVNGVDMKNFTLVLDLDRLEGYPTTNIQQFRNELYSASGYWLDVGTKDKLDTYEHAFIIRSVEEAGEAGFRAYVDEAGDFIVECAYNNAFDGAFGDFSANVFTTQEGHLNFNYELDADLNTPISVYEKPVSIVYYEDFGAIGNGSRDDFEAIYNTHIYANDGGQKVMSRGGANAIYYIKPSSFTKSIPVKTNVDLNGCTFKVDDVGNDAFDNYKLHFFDFLRDHDALIFDDIEKNVVVIDPVTGEPALDSKGQIKMTVDGLIDDERFQGIKLMNKTDENKDDPNVYDNFSWLVDAGVLVEDSLIRITNSLHRDFIRHGSNQNSGNPRTDVFVVSKDGTISEETPIVYEFDNISKIEIFRTDDKPITFENGHFINICCRAVQSTTYKTPNGVVTHYANDWIGYQRTLGLFRCNTTVKNLTHNVQDEPVFGSIPAGSGYIKDTLHNNYGSRHESYPYYGFLYIYNTYNFNAYNVQLTGHTTYYEDKPATASTGWQIPNPVAMGTYDLIVEYSSHVYLHDVVQVNSSTPTTGLADGRYWGIMSSNGARNMYFYDCKINRFDAHRGFWNAELYNTEIGHSFQVVGGGRLIADGVTKWTKSNFMMFRGDYGATFNGDIILKDCVYEAYETYNTVLGQKNTTTMPNNEGRRAECVIFDPQYDASNYGYVADNPKTEEKGDADFSGAYWMWYFGYDCYMPRNITIDNFTYNGTGRLAVFDYLPDEIFTKSYTDDESVTDKTVKYPYIITESITFKNTKTLPAIVFSEDAKKLNAIRVIWEK